MMGLERHLQKWLAAGLIDGAAVGRIRDYEAENGRPIALWAVAGLGLLALALGLALIVGANWDRIAGPVKLAVHFAATGAAAIAVFEGSRRSRAWQAEGALFLFVALVLAGIALQGQIYQETAPIWQPLALWALLCGPVLMLVGATWLTGSALALMLGALAVALAVQGFEHHDDVQTLFVGAAGAIPFAVVAMAALPRRGGSFAPSLAFLGLSALLALASLAHFVWTTTVTAADARDALESLLLPLAAALACLAVFRREEQALRNVVSAVVISSFLATALAVLIPHGEGWSWRLAGALSFAVMWGAIAFVAARQGWRFLFGIAMAAIAIRLFIVYFELFGSLAATGAGLMAGGLIVLVLAAAWRRLMTLVPARNGARP
jgi:uncharacterized membrane protein